MGTSISYRSPREPRWHAFVAALQSPQITIQRARSELFNAGAAWKQEFSNRAIASYADTLRELFDGLPARATNAIHSQALVHELLEVAQARSRAEGQSGAGALAFRAFSVVLVRALGDSLLSVSSTPRELANSWILHRGSSKAEIVADYLGELLGQFARHVTDREAGRLISMGVRSGDAERLADALAIEARTIGVEVGLSTDNQSTTQSWAQLVDQAFEVGQTLPGSNP